MNKQVRDLLETVYAQSVDIESSRSIGGGCINQTLALTLSNGETVFLKHNDHPPDGMFEKEARGLNLMRQAKNGPRIPKWSPCPREPNPHFLIIEYIEAGNPGNGYYERFGQALASMHRTTQDHYGLDHDNFIGSTEQINTPETDGLVFFREHRLGFQQKLARERGLLPVPPIKKSIASAINWVNGSISPANNRHWSTAICGRATPSPTARDVPVWWTRRCTSACAKPTWP